MKELENQLQRPRSAPNLGGLETGKFGQPRVSKNAQILANFRKCLKIAKVMSQLPLKINTKYRWKRDEYCQFWS
jgi:hypothetical protein